jgi:hypothetical protein
MFVSVSFSDGKNFLSEKYSASAPDMGVLIPGKGWPTSKTNGVTTIQ